MMHIYLLPVYNEEKIINKSVALLHEVLSRQYLGSPQQFKIAIIDNASNDSTRVLVQQLQGTYQENLMYFYTSQKGRGSALKRLSREYDADHYTYLDIDLPIELDKLPDFVGPVVSGDYDISLVKRLGSRSFGRVFMTKLHQLFSCIFLNLPFSDPQSGAKTYNRNVAKTIFPLTHQTGYFFDTEILALAKLKGMRIKEIPLTWIESRFSGRHSKVKRLRDSLEAFLAIIDISRRNFPLRFFIVTVTIFSLLSLVTLSLYVLL